MVAGSLADLNQRSNHLYHINRPEAIVKDLVQFADKEIEIQKDLESLFSRLQHK
jgi:hypothetical protein